MGQALRAGASELLGKIDLLAGRRMVYVEEVRLQKSGHYLVEWHALVGESPKRMESLERPASEATRLPSPEQVYLDAKEDHTEGERTRSPISLVPLRPLIVYDPRLLDVFFLNSRGKGQRCNYLCFTTGEHQDLDELEGEQRGLLARVLGQSVDAAEFARWGAPDNEEEPDEPAPPLAAKPLRRVDEFELLSELGRGNMGTVYRAWQPSLGRQVALKVIAGVNDEKAKARFRREVRALGRVDHPHLVKIYTSGFDDEICFYTMELVEGASLAAISDSLHSRGTAAAAVDLTTWREAISTACEECRKSEKSLSTAGEEPTATVPAAGVRHSGVLPELTAGSPGYTHQVVELIRQVAQAAHALHGAGVVHRDIKPANIMVTADGGQAVLMDLGIAQLADDVEGRITKTRQFIGTVRYASPEQVLSVGKLDARSDVYSLGATLWELLTLRPIHDATDLTPDAEVMMRITSKEPDLVRKHHPGIARDLEAIVQKCLEKDPSQRYTTASELADDLGRWQRGELVAAQPLSMSYLASKFLRRYKLPLSAATLALLLLAAGTVLAFVRINVERNDAVAARKREGREKEKAQEALESLTKSRKESVSLWNVVDQAYTKIKENDIRHLPGLGAVQEELANIHLEGMKQLATDTPDDPTVTPKLARAHTILGMVCSHVGSFERSRSNLQAAVDIYQKLADSAPGQPEYKLLSCRALYEMAWLLWSNGQYEDALRFLERSTKLADAALRDDPQNADLRFELARACSTSANCTANQALREQLAVKARSLYEALLAEKYREVDVRAGLAVAEDNLARVRWDGKDESAFRASFDELRKQAKEALKHRKDSPYLRSFELSYYSTKANSLIRSGKLDEALAELEARVALSRSIVKSTPEGVRYQWLLANSLQELASGYRRKQRPADARAAYDECNQVMDALVRRAPDRSSFATEWIRYRLDMAEFFGLANPAVDQVRAGQDRLRALEQAATRGKEFGARFPRAVDLQKLVAKALINRGQYDSEAKREKEAFPYLAEAVEVYRTRVLPAEATPLSDTEIAEFLSHVRSANACAEALKRTEDAVRITRMAHEIGRSTQSSEAVNDLCVSLGTTARLHAAAGHTKDAIEAYREIERLCQPVLAKEDWNWYIRSDLAGAYFHLAEIYQKAGDAKNEVLANREYLKFWSKPMQGMKIDDYVDVSHPADLAEAVRIREFFKKSPGMKRFTVPCDFNGLKYPFNVYVTEVPWPKDPLEDQARWLWEKRGGTIPKEVREAFNKLHKIAYENKVSFQDLCVYALGTAAAEAGQQVKVEAGADARGRGSSAGHVDLSPASVQPGASDPQAPLKARLVDLKTKIDNAPNDLRLLADMARTYDALARTHLEAKNDRESMTAWEPCLRIRETIARAKPLDTEVREELAKTYQEIGRIHARARDFDHAYEMYHRQMDVLETVIAENYSATARAAVTETQMLLGELFDAKGDKVEAVRWELKAMARGDSRAAKKVALLTQLLPDVAALLPTEARAVLARTKELTKANAKAKFEEVFAEELEKANKQRLAQSNRDQARERDQKVALLGEAAEHFQSLAKGYAAEGKKELALDMYSKEADLRGQQVAANNSDPKLKESQKKAALAAGGLAAEVGRWADAFRLLTKARSLGGDEANLALADMYEQGKGVAKNTEMADLLRVILYIDNGNRAISADHYADAVPDLKRGLSLAKSVKIRAPLLAKLGLCHLKLGQYDEAIACYSQAFELYVDDLMGPTILLDLVEAMVCGDRPSDAIHFLDSLNAKGWKPKLKPDTSFRFDAVSVGYRAIALRLTGQDAAAEEKRLAELLDRPNMRVMGWDWDVIDKWLARSRSEASKLEAAKKILATLRAPSKELKSVLYPLKAGSAWTYKGNSDLTIRVVGREGVAGREYYRLEGVVAGKVGGSEYVAVEPDGVYRQWTGTIKPDPHLMLLPAAPKAGDRWEIDSKLPTGQVTGRGVVRVEDVKVPAGTFAKAVVVEWQTSTSSGVSTTTTWYAENVGPVKIVTRSSTTRSTLDLVKYTEGPLVSKK
jgi:serine/threonine protein kinase